MDEPQPRKTRVFVIGSGGLGLVAFEAISLREALGLRKELWFRDELMSLRSNRNPVWDGKALLNARIAEPNEVVEYQNAKAEAPATEDDEILLVYLIPLDA